MRRSDPAQPKDTTDRRVVKTSENQKGNCCERTLIFLSILLLIIFPPALLFCFVIVNEFQRAVMLRVGRLTKGGPRGPGIIFTLPCVDSYVKLDLRTTSFNVPTQEILTRDSVTISLDAVVYYYIKDPIRAVMQVSNFREATRLLAQTTLRNVAGTKNLLDLLTEKESVSQSIEQILDEATEPWGIKVERVEIKNVWLPEELQRAMAAEAEASREARAKFISAEGELNASRALREASDIMAANPIALQLRYLQTLSNISAERNSTIIFPFPIEMMPGMK